MSETAAEIPADDSGAERLAQDSSASAKPLLGTAEGLPVADVLLDLAKIFGYISLLTIGGGVAAFPELKTLTVESHHWLTAHRLIHLYSVGNLAPGPNMLMVVAIGQMVAGFPGALVSGLAFSFPLPSLL